MSGEKPLCNADGWGRGNATTGLIVAVMTLLLVVPGIALAVIL
ncbi:hypothetical protein [Micromonospora tarensis]|nr:hypothetical protein [Micromonospora tarensis]